MKTKELHNKSPVELQALLQELRERLAQMSFDLADRKLKDTSVIGKAKRDIARILTILNAS